MTPAALEAGVSSATVIVTGSNFVPGTTANWNLAILVTPPPAAATVAYISDTELQLTFASAAIANPGIGYLSLTNAAGPGLGVYRTRAHRRGADDRYHHQRAWRRRHV
jgi:hypothetical protein